MNDLWINKYKPKFIKNIIGNVKQIESFKQWLNNSVNSSIIISGNQGLGKTLTIKLILEEFNYNIRIINPNEIKDHRLLDDFNDYYNFVSSIYSKISFNNTINKKIALIFDETENISLTSEKKYIMDIHKYNNKLKAFPLIFISNNQHSKLLNDLKKNCDEIIFEVPFNNEIKQIISNILIHENIKFEDDFLIDKIIELSQNDVRRLINLLQELSLNYNNLITKKNIEEFINKTREKDIDIGLFNSTVQIINNYLPYDSIIKLYETEKVLLPLMIYENYLKKMNTENNINNIRNISNSISIGDNIETSIYTDQNWYLQNIHGFFSCINTSYWINKNNSKSEIDIDDIKFSSDLNKTSLKNINKKNINNLSKVINNKSNQEILMLNKICNHLIENNKEQELIDILKSYNKNITIKEIELCLKIDKTSEFNTLGSKDKKRISKQIF
jgi:DNA polymerase III delta prime subunit